MKINRTPHILFLKPRTTDIIELNKKKDYVQTLHRVVDGSNFYWNKIYVDAEN